MVRLGIIETVGLAVSLALALPIAVFGASMLLDGDLLGAVFLAVAVVLVVAQHVLTTPQDIPSTAAERLTGLLVGKRDK